MISADTLKYYPPDLFVLLSNGDLIKAGQQQQC